MLMLFCIDDETKLCLKCVAKHGGHNIYDFEDVCLKIVKPRLDSVKDGQLQITESLTYDLEQISEKCDSLKAL